MNKNLLLSKLNVLVEETMNVTASKTTAADGGKRNQRGKSLKNSFAGIERDSSGNAIVHWQVESASEEGNVHHCYVDIIPHGTQSLFTLAHSRYNLAAKMNLIKSANVKCSCDCKDFMYSGAAWNQKHLDHGLSEKFDNPNYVDRAPKKRDPRHKMTICKHLYATFNGIKTNALVVMNAVKNAKFPAATAPTSKSTDKMLNDESKDAEELKRTADTSLLQDKQPDTPVKDNTSDKAKSMLENAEAEFIPEASDALDALAETIAKPEADSPELQHDSSLMDEQSEPEETKRTSSLLEKPDVPNNMADIAAESELPFFDVPATDEED